MKQYSVDSKIKQLSRGELFLILLIFLCAIRIVFNAVRNTYSFNDPFQYLDYLIFLILALGSLYLVLRKKLIAKIRGSYLKIDTDQFSFKSRGVEKEFKDFRLIKAIQFQANAILVTDICDSQYTIFLDDFINPGERQEIIAYFEKVLNEVNESLK